MRKEYKIMCYDWGLSRDGFIRHYMIAGPGVEDYESDISDSNQLDLEGRLRSLIVTEKAQKIKTAVKMGQLAENGKVWRPCYSYGNDFVDVSAFYSTLQKVTFDAATALYIKEDTKVNAVLWTYMAVGVYCNGELIAEEKKPAYKPIRKKKFTIPLKKGKNILYFTCDNLGVRDTRNILGVQILDRRDEIRVQMPDDTCQNVVYEMESFLDQLKIEEDHLILPSEAPQKTSIAFHPISPDYQIMKQPLRWQDISGRSTDLPLKEAVLMTAKCELDGFALSRDLEFTDRVKPEYTSEDASATDHYFEIAKRIAQVDSLNRGSFGFAISNLLARKYTQTERQTDRDLLFETLDLIEKRVDCADFLVCGLLRYMHNYELDEELSKRAKDVLLHYRYWMNMEGTDAMCFWSENHSLMFYMSAMDAGNFYPGDYFTRAKMTGRELSAYGKKKVKQWLADVETYGFEEFLSNTYMCVTFAVLLNVIDYTEPEMSKKATSIADQLLLMLSEQTFKGCVIAPMGRAYREVIYPFSQGTQSIINLIDPAAPYSYGEGWLAFLATSKYKIPEGLPEKMNEKLETAYESGNAKIYLEKNEDYILTSVASPREADYKRWNNVHVHRDADTDLDSQEYTKSMNECFHGTSNFGPGVYGYQQHLWYAALDPEAVLFVNHPGSTTEDSELRPGYWHGNGVMPALLQTHGTLGAIYAIPSEYPVNFTHVYCPRGRYEKTKVEKHWIFMKKGSGYLALWSSGELIPYHDRIFNCEFRVYKKTNAYLCICGKSKDYASFEDFIHDVKGRKPEFDSGNLSLHDKNGYHLQYVKAEDDTQYID